MFLTSNHCFKLKYESIIHKNYSSCEKVVSEILNQERNIHRSSTVYKPKQSKTALKIFDVRGQQEMDFLSGGSALWILDRCGSLKLKQLSDGFIPYKHSFSLHKTLIVVLEWCGVLWCFYQLFGLSFWRHPFTAEYPLGGQVMEWYISPMIMNSANNGLMAKCHAPMQSLITPSTYFTAIAKAIRCRSLRTLMMMAATLKDKTGQLHVHWHHHQ